MKWKWKSLSHVWLFVTPWIYRPWHSPGHISGVGSLSPLQRIFPTQGSNPGLPNCRWILFQLSHKGSPRILKWAAYRFSNRSFQPRNQTGVSCISGRFFTSWGTREAHCNCRLIKFSSHIGCWPRLITGIHTLEIWSRSSQSTEFFCVSTTLFIHQFNCSRIFSGIQWEKMSDS